MDFVKFNAGSCADYPQGLVQCVLFFLNSLVHVSSKDSAAVKEVGSLVTWGKIQKITDLLMNAAIQKMLMGARLRCHVGEREILKTLMDARLCRHVEKREILKFLMGSNLPVLGPTAIVDVASR